jgi:hypothetical protein
MTESNLRMGPIKLECLSMAILSSLVLCITLIFFYPIVSYEENEVLWNQYLEPYPQHLFSM